MVFIAMRKRRLRNKNTPPGGTQLTEPPVLMILALTTCERPGVCRNSYSRYKMMRNQIQIIYWHLGFPYMCHAAESGEL